MLELYGQALTTVFDARSPACARRSAPHRETPADGSDQHVRPVTEPRARARSHHRTSEAPRSSSFANHALAGTPNEGSGTASAYNARVATAGYASLAASDPEDGESVARGELLLSRDHSPRPPVQSLFHAVTSAAPCRAACGESRRRTVRATHPATNPQVSPLLGGLQNCHALHVVHHRKDVGLPRIPGNSSSSSCRPASLIHPRRNSTTRGWRNVPRNGFVTGCQLIPPSGSTTSLTRRARASPGRRACSATMGMKGAPSDWTRMPAHPLEQRSNLLLGIQPFLVHDLDMHSAESALSPLLVTASSGLGEEAPASRGSAATGALALL